MIKMKNSAFAKLTLTVLLGTSTLCSAAPTESFDKPIRKTVIDLGRSQYSTPNSPSLIELSCFYYSQFMVKELRDQGVKGVLWVTVSPVTKEETPACRLERASSERFMAKEWWGFEGVKGSLLFLEAADGDSNTGMPFRVLDVNTGEKIFEDSSSWNGHMSFEHAPDGNLSLRYLRVVGGDCSIPKDGLSCWSKYKRHYGLALATVPNCSGYRREGETEWVAGDPGVPPEGINTPSAISYPVAVVLFPLPSIRSVPGRVRCFPVD